MRSHTLFTLHSCFCVCMCVCVCVCSCVCVCVRMHAHILMPVCLCEKVRYCFPLFSTVYLTKINGVRSVYDTFQKTSPKKACLHSSITHAPPQKTAPASEKNTPQTCRIQPGENLKQHTLTLTHTRMLVYVSFVAHEIGRAHV